MKNRIIKTDFWLDEKVSKLPAHVRLTYICLWGLADDKGRIKGNHLTVKNAAFAYDNEVTNDAVRMALTRLEEIGRIVRYIVDGENYILVVRLVKHQKTSGNNPSKYPPPPIDKLKQLGLNEEAIKELVDDRPYNDKTRKIKSDIKVERKEDVQEVFLTWVKHTKKTGNVICTAEREALIENALGLGYAAQDLKEAIYGCCVSPFHRGENKTKTV